MSVETSIELRAIGTKVEGRPKGSPISPLLSNLYMRRFVLGWKKLGHEERMKAYIVNYADDCVPRARKAERLSSGQLLN
jgi:RNA-directed DNA polymerase